MSGPFHVLFICTANACRSQMAEAMLRHLGGRRFVVRSAGVSQAGFIHPYAAAAMSLMSIPMTSQYSKSLDDVLDTEHDIIITVCDAVACLSPPKWLGQPVCAHWSLPDPVLYPGTEDERLDVAKDVARKLYAWIEQLVALPLETLTPQELKDALFRIAES